VKYVEQEVVLAACSAFTRAFPTGVDIFAAAMRDAGLSVEVHDNLDGCFPDGDLCVDLPAEPSNRRVLLLQSMFGSQQPPDTAVMAMLATARAYRENGAGSVDAFVPYLPYSRHDRQVRGQRRPVMAGLIAELCDTAGIDHVLTLPSGNTELLRALYGTIRLTMLDVDDLLHRMVAPLIRADSILVAPDAGATRQAERLALDFGVPLVSATKRRIGPERVALRLHDRELPAGARHAVIVDDLITSAGTVEMVVKALRDRNPSLETCVVAPHLRLTSTGITRIERLRARGQLRGVVTTDSTGRPPALAGLEVTQALPYAAPTVARILADSVARAGTTTRSPASALRPTTQRPVLSVSVICLDQTRLREEIDKLRALGVARLHIDLAEPAFGGRPGLPVEIIGDLRRWTDLPLDVHVMMTRPDPVLPEIVSGGADSICVHQRSLDDALARTLRELVEKDVEIALAVGPDETIDDSAVEAVAPHRVTVMCVAPGGAGRPFQQSSLRVVAAADRLRAAGAIRHVEVDGAVSRDTAPLLVAAGADRLVLGSRMLSDRLVTTACFEEFWRALGIVESDNR
jgi:ribose-phosphate pyrophosphokinase